MATPLPQPQVLGYTSDQMLEYAEACIKDISERIFTTMQEDLANKAFCDAGYAKRIVARIRKHVQDTTEATAASANIRASR